ncbi:hypothetical protein IU402_04045 [Aerococcaceae bacterium zg-BR9]|uniref:hypothetical protein n=1 Tax=Aerococcaceae bacterium zg-1292 TaxID=2774330 RepID=UPI0040640340|nr:hypothetical protein [Aerococcaceae bacterium zg-BR9]MBF6978686.1 hypothetical protein [Aerococcaceae bacterium zg-BR22]
MTIKESILQELVKQGYVIYLKDDKIVKEKAPVFGEITLTYQNNKLVLLTKTETKK